MCRLHLVVLEERRGVEVEHVKRVARGSLVEPLERICGHVVVGVDEQQILARGDGDASVAGAGEPPVLLVENDDARVLGGEARDDLAGPVGGAVVDAHDLDVGQRLRNEAFQTLGKVGLGVVDRHDDGDSSHGCYSPSRPGGDDRLPHRAGAVMLLASR